RQGGSGVCGSFDRVNVEVICAQMTWVALQHGLQNSHNFLGARCGSAVAIVKFPWVQVHAAFRKERRRVEIVGILLVDLSHGVVVGGFEAFVVRVRLVSVTLGERFDVVALVARSVCRERQSLLHVLVGQLFPLTINGQVVVGSEHQRYAPIRHGHFRVELDGLAETLFSLAMIEAVVECHALLEQALSLSTASLYGVMNLAEILRPTGGRYTRSARSR